MKIINLIDKKFGRLVVIKRLPNQKKKVYWLCRCNCGKLCSVTSSNLLQGKILSCGCLKKEKLLKRNITHNQRHTNLYEVWKSIKQRCFNPKSLSYRNYGGRGITMCEEWKSNFFAFYQWAIENDYCKNSTIDRIDNNGNYEPSNCRWVNRNIQANNTRANRYITINGKTKTVSQWAKEKGINANIIYNRLYRGWDEKKAILTPIIKK